MVDYIKIKISSGSGGNGAISFRKEKYVPFGGPDGGWGGRGGDAYIVGDEEVRDLGHLSGISEVKAEVGMSGAGSNRVGRDGGDAEVVVPTGTAVVFGTGRSAEKHEVLGNGQRVRVAVGGMGGRGNRAFATSVMKVPRIAESGEKGQAWWVQLHFKTLADIAIVGLANSGKSSLLNRVTGAGVKVADYPMTTVEPVVGVVEHGWRQYRIVEVPSLWLARGLGSEGDAGSVLKHAERAAVLVLLVEATAESSAADYGLLVDALAAHGGGLVEKQRVVLLTKTDLDVDQSRITSAVDKARDMGVPVYPVSLADGAGVAEAMEEIVRLVDERRPMEGQPEPPTYAVFKPRPRRPRLSVKRDKNGFVVSYEPVERMVAATDIRDWEARAQLMTYVERAGVHRALEKAGVKPGDRVMIGETEMEWE